WISEWFAALGSWAVSRSECPVGLLDQQSLQTRDEAAAIGSGQMRRERWHVRTPACGFGRDVLLEQVHLFAEFPNPPAQRVEQWTIFQFRQSHTKSPQPRRMIAKVLGTFPP